MNLFDQLEVMKSNRHYRLGDLIFCKGKRWEYDRDQILNNSEFQDTFLRRYLQSKNPSKKIDENCLKKCAHLFREKVQTTDHTLYINFRLGDVVLDHLGNIGGEKCYGRLLDLFLYNPGKLYSNIKQILSNQKINNIKIVSALHFGDNDQHGWWQFSEDAVAENKILFDNTCKNIQDLFDLPISIEASEVKNISHIDKDFAILFSAQHVLLDSGGFGDCVNLIRSII